jgi:hypothetical protein
MRELLRRAAEEFADRLYEIFRAELMEEIRRELGRAARADEAAPSSDALTAMLLDAGVAAPSKLPRSPAADRIVADVVANPGVGPAEIIEALGISRKTVFNALAQECALGVLRKAGRAPRVAYFGADGPELPSTGRVRPKVRSARGSPDASRRRSRARARHRRVQRERQQARSHGTGSSRPPSWQP